MIYDGPRAAQIPGLVDGRRQNVEMKEVAENDQAHLLSGFAELDNPEDKPSDTEDEEDGVSDPGESSDEETTDAY